jgi:hypothetical protein
LLQLAKERLGMVAGLGARQAAMAARVAESHSWARACQQWEAAMQLKMQQVGRGIAHIQSIFSWAGMALPTWRVYSHGLASRLTTSRVYSHGLASHWAHSEYILWHGIAHVESIFSWAGIPFDNIQSIFSWAGIPLGTFRVYSHGLAWHCPRGEYILMGWHPI